MYCMFFAIWTVVNNLSNNNVKFHVLHGIETDSTARSCGQWGVSPFVENSTYYPYLLFYWATTHRARPRQLSCQLSCVQELT